MISDQFLLPPVLVNSSAAERKAGFEIEFTGLKLTEIAWVVISVFGGHVKEITPYKFEVRETRYGTFSVELDFRFLKEELLKEELETLGLIDEDDLAFIRKIEESIASVSETVVPYEISTPPIPLSQLSILEMLEEKLRCQGALGTDASLFYAFGLHINPEVPSLDVSVLLRYFRAFLILYEWLVYTSKTDLLRRMTTYIKPFEDAYVVLVLDASYKPDIEQFIKDYLLFNPTRNRPLDMLPLFKFIDKEKVEAVVKDPRISARPTFHYRLPDCRIGSEIHNLAHAWNRWVEVEKLAEDEKSLELYGKAYLEYLEDPFSVFEENWAQKIEKWLMK